MSEPLILRYVTKSLYWLNYFSFFSEAGCNYWSYGHCVLIKGMPYLLGPLMPLKEKEHLCETRYGIQ